MVNLKTILISISFICYLSIIYTYTADAKVTGRCSNCHTMHNSQNGSSVAAGGPYQNLVINSCIGCHSANSQNTSKYPVTGAPIVYNISGPPTYGASSDGGTTHQGLAGGNFYWVKTDDAKGHNVFQDNPDDLLTDAPGRDMPPKVCANGACHSNLSVAGAGDFANRQGCTDCHMLSKYVPGNPIPIKGYHHANDSETIVGSGVPDTDGYYRYLQGHVFVTDRGVTGIEDPNWEVNPDVSHNEYKGVGGRNHTDDYFGLVLGEGSMTSYCVGCHAKIHWELNSSDKWIRHPSDAVLPTTGEYSAYTTYDPLVPVARPDLSNIGDPTKVRPGTDMVMCLSCHRAHGSPYNDMLRWDYSTMNAGGGGSGGCFTCHTQKNQPP